MIEGRLHALAGGRNGLFAHGDGGDGFVPVRLDSKIA